MPQPTAARSGHPPGSGFVLRTQTIFEHGEFPPPPPPTQAGKTFTMEARRRTGGDGERVLRQAHRARRAAVDGTA